MMLMTKRAKFLARLGSRHRPSFRTPPNELPSETVYQWNALVPLDLGNCIPVLVVIRQRRSGVKVLFPESAISELWRAPGMNGSRSSNFLHTYGAGATVPIFIQIFSFEVVASGMAW